MITTSIVANATFTEADGTFVIAGNEIHTTDVSINFTEEQAITVGLDILKYFRNSETFKTEFPFTLKSAKLSFPRYIL